VTFETTPVMSTYLLAFVIGGYSSVSEGIQTMFYPTTYEDDDSVNGSLRAEFTLALSIDVLELFDGAQGFNIPYTESGIPKLDSIGVSDFAAGGISSFVHFLFCIFLFLMISDGELGFECVDLPIRFSIVTKCHKEDLPR